MSETWTCAECSATVVAPDDPEHAWWELFEKPGEPDPEQWPVYCPGCLYTPEERAAIEERLSKIVLTNEEKVHLASVAYRFLSEREGRN